MTPPRQPSTFIDLGMGAVWIDHGNGEEPAVQPDLVISDLSELPDA